VAVFLACTMKPSREKLFTLLDSIGCRDDLCQLHKGLVFRRRRGQLHHITTSRDIPVLAWEGLVKFFKPPHSDFPAPFPISLSRGPAV
jgi:hypothetical protein